jgi:outer membrane protein OmpA-like peptidoglycan-associated protein
VFLWAVGLGTVALVGSAVGVTRWSARGLRRAFAVGVGLAALAIAWMALRATVDAASPLQARGGARGAAAPVAAAAGRVDYLTFAWGAIPVRVGGASAALGAGFEHAVRAVDGDPDGFNLTLKPGDAVADTEFVYQLPAATTFDRFAVPNVLETPSPGETFTREVEIAGSATSATDGFTVLATATLATHSAPNQFTELTLRATVPVRWVRVRLVGGIQPLRPQMFYEFSEIVGNGTQDVPALVDRFRGTWKGRGVLITLQQDGAVVTGCYDRDGELTGTVIGNMLRAVGQNRSNRVRSAFILHVREDGTLMGLRSTNGAPFATYTGEGAPAGSGPMCPPPPPAALGCGSVVHGITFDFDSAVIRPESAPVLAALYTGLSAAPDGRIAIEGHTSSEGTDQYNLALSERRAQAVVADLVRRGLAASRLTAVGVGEKQPIASNADESGRSLNRRVEIRCT